MQIITVEQHWIYSSRNLKQESPERPTGHFCHVILTFPSTVFRKLLCTELVDFKAPLPLTQLHYNTTLWTSCFMDNPCPTPFLQYQAADFLIVYLPPLEQVSCRLRGASSGKQHCTVLQNLPCTGAGNVGHCLEPSSSHGNAETSGSG